MIDTTVLLWILGLTAAFGCGVLVGVGCAGFWTSRIVTTIEEIEE